MLQKFGLVLLLSVVVNPALGIVTRSDVPADKYIAEEIPKFLVDMPGEGHGVLIAGDWILTVAHLIFSDYTGKKISINNNVYQIEKVFLYEQPKSPDESLFEGDAGPLMQFMKSTNDIALIKLTTEVIDAQPIGLFNDSNEVGLVVEAFGRGSTGNGKVGSIFESKREKVLRKMQNRIDSVDGNWISISFDSGADALEFEGIDGSGDSGGPLIVYQANKPMLVGMFSWDYVEGDLKAFKHGIYGTRSYQVRISQYFDWINATIDNN